jgi:hypothetical protein
MVWVPGDGAPINRWRHWFCGNFSSPTYGNVTVYMYLARHKYEADKLKATGIKMQDESNAKSFSVSLGLNATLFLAF